jgi:hypothetical protein
MPEKGATHRLAPSYGFAPQSADGVMIEVQRLNRDHVLTRVGLHGHPFFELIYFERGGGSHALGGVRSRVQQGSLFVICPGELHDCTEMGRAEGWVLLFTRAALERSPESLAFSHPYLIRGPTCEAEFRSNYPWWYRTSRRCGRRGTASNFGMPGSGDDHQKAHCATIAGAQRRSRYRRC